jgi:hypothetical protein
VPLLSRTLPGRHPGVVVVEVVLVEVVLVEVEVVLVVVVVPQ